MSAQPHTPGDRVLVRNAPRGTDSCGVVTHVYRLAWASGARAPRVLALYTVQLRSGETLTLDARQVRSYTRADARFEGLAWARTWAARIEGVTTQEMAANGRKAVKAVAGA